MKGSVLVVDDEKGQREILRMILSQEGYSVSAVANGYDALSSLERNEYDIILTDLKMQNISGQELLERVLADTPQQCVIIMTAHGTVDSAVAAMKQGAFDYLEKPLDRETLLLTLARAFERLELIRENQLLHRQLLDAQPIPALIGSHASMKEVYRIIGKVADSLSTVLIIGESGTGKELVARAIHDASGRKNNPFMAINCAAIPESLIESELFGHEKGAFTGATSRQIGLFEAARSGTVFLDEIGELPVTMQAKLLRVIQEREIRRVGGTSTISVDVRIISATNKDIEQEIRAGRFREDLFYRLNVIRITLPPLRQRGTDIITLAEHFVAHYARLCGARVNGISRLALNLLLDYSWPGNVRQLASAIERSVLMAEGEIVQPGDLPAEIRCASVPKSPVPYELPPEGVSFEAVERSLIMSAMERSGWVVSKAAPLLGMTYKTLQYRLEKFGIEKPSCNRESVV